MRKSRLIITAVALVAAYCGGTQLPVCLAQQATTSGTPHAGQAASATEPAFYILAEFTHSLNARKLKPGDRIEAEVTQDVLSHGRIIIPVESRLIGHVTEVKPHLKDDPESRLGMIFDKVLLRHRIEVDFRGVLHALSAPAVRRSRVDEPDQMLSPIGQPQGAVPNGTGRNSAGMIGGSSSSLSENPAGIPPAFSNNPPLTNVPTTAASNAAAGIPNQAPLPSITSSEQKPMSVGMPLGVFGLKGLNLTTGASDSTPGPVIVCRVDDVKVESGTQILLKITQVTVHQP